MNLKTVSGYVLMTFSRHGGITQLSVSFNFSDSQS